MNLLLRTLFSLALTASAAFAAESQPASSSPTSSATGGDLMARVKIETNKGDMVVELNGEKAPISTLNFLTYVDEKFYDGLTFHRIRPDFMIQGGGYTKDLSKKEATHPPISNEWRNGLKNERGTLAMARTSDPNSATSEFFINTVDNKFLDEPRDGAAYAVFGKVIEGMDTVDAIKNVPTHPEPKTGGEAAPNEPVIIKTMTIIKDVDRAKLKEQFGAAERQAKEAQEKALAAATEQLTKEADGKVETGKDGLKLFVIKPGTGDSAANAETVKLNLALSLPNGEKLFDSKDAGGAQTMTVRGKMPGMMEAIKMMKAGETAKALVPPALAYGEQGAGAVPPNSYVVLTIELLEVNSAMNAGSAPTAPTK